LEEFVANETVFKRYSGNPIITSEAVPNANVIMNSAVVKFKGAYAGVFRVDTQEMVMELHVGFSQDGLNWDIQPERLKLTGEVPKLIPCGMGYDPRITKIGDVYYITWCYYPYPSGPAIGLAQTRDFKKFRQMSTVLLPYNRNAVLFPRKINGQYAILHRPSDNGHTPFGDIYYATSKDILNWGNHQFVFGKTSGWQQTKVGAGPTPIETKEGWVMIYHGVHTTCNGFVYSMGGAILDLDKPWKVKYRTRRYLMAPTESYERVGFVPNVVFPTAAILDEKSGKIDVYYGAADTYVALASADFEEMVQFIKKNSY
jgi:beta-1,4-mannooligosaccharide/beta-1,4-mannosyl-N-acetylglucosamine phosphorylase